MSEKNNVTRFVKSVKGTYTDIKNDKLTSKINRIARIISDNGGKIISYSQPTVVCVGMSAVFIVIMIIYEASEEIPAEAFKEKRINE